MVKSQAGQQVIKAGVWFRVSTDHQEAANQEAAIGQLIAHRGWEPARTFELADSAWNGGKTGGDYKAQISAVLDAAHRGEFQVLVVWALDRITREGAEGALRLIRQLRERGCTLVSVHEPWLTGSPEIQDVLVAFAGWMAQQESTRRSERIRAGLARRRAEGKPVGRQPGVRDKGQRRRSGYVASWETGGARRSAQTSAGKEA
jgi:DNA invertase Pin-like site-specific DNA recombinase